MEPCNNGALYCILSKINTDEDFQIKRLETKQDEKKKGD